MTRHARGMPFPTDLDAGAVAGLVTTLTLGTAFGLVALGVDWFWVAFPVGFGGVLPVAVGAAKRRRRRGERRDGERDGWRREAEAAVDASDDTDAALARLRERYASGELDEAAFEARLERLLLTEDTASARTHAAAGRAQSGQDGTAEGAGQVSDD
ncbi:MAG: SHOCT domain-containing protein [Haloglomus sp.]